MEIHLVRLAMRSALLTIFTIAFFSGGTLKSQDTTLPGPTGYNDPYIEWVEQYPSDESMQHARFGEKLKNLLFGRRSNIDLVQPVAVIAFNVADYFILDQNKGAILNVKGKVGDITHLRDKEYKHFVSLVGICKYVTGKILFSDSYLNKVFYFTPGRKNIGVLNDTLTLNRPTGIAYLPDKEEVWIVETGAHRISVLSVDGRLLRRIGSRGTAPGEFNFPTSVWIDNSGKVFIVDAMNFRIQVFSPDGEVISVFGKPGDASGYFARPRGIATDSQGNIYVTDALYNTVQVFDVYGNFLYNFGMQGRGKGAFWMPSGIFIDDEDHIYVADTYNARIQVFRFIKGGKQ